MDLRQLFIRHVAQTSDAPLSIEMERAEGAELFDASGKRFIDLIGGISVANTGHRHPAVVSAIKKQLDHYLHVMVYGEFIQSPQVRYAAQLTHHLPSTLDAVYFTNSGAEAVEGAMKLAKRATGRHRIVAFHNAYHGSTQGALSLIGSECWRNSFRPLLPGIDHLDYNSFPSLECITTDTACVIAETVQGEAGINAPSAEWMQALRRRCSETGALLVLDEIQAGFGRTGKLWGFEHFNIVPDVLLLGKALGGGMPLGAFITARERMHLLAHNPVLGHITTFGGHPVSCAAGGAAFEVLLQEKLAEGVNGRTALFLELLKHREILSVRSFGLWIAVEFKDHQRAKSIIDRAISGGVLTDWFLFAPQCLRISPPLTISEDEIRESCRILLSAMDQAGA